MTSGAKTPTSGTLLGTYAALLALLALTAVAAKVSFGAWNLPIALLIAVVKTALVFAIFMRLREQRGLVRVFALVGFAWLAILLLLTWADYQTRDRFLRLEGHQPPPSAL